jgi:hypothetical protein
MIIARLIEEPPPDIHIFAPWVIGAAVVFLIFVFLIFVFIWKRDR